MKSNVTITSPKVSQIGKEMKLQLPVTETEPSEGIGTMSQTSSECIADVSDKIMYIER